MDNDGIVLPLAFNKIHIMSTKLIAMAAASMVLIGFSACNNPGGGQAAATDSTAVAEPLTIVPAGNSPQFPDAELGIKDPVIVEAAGPDSVKITLNYDVKNYELKGQTADAGEKGCSNSKQGQHIHFILDNGPYSALYEPTHTFTVAVNSEHYIMSFLSRSYHESIKSPKAGVLYHFAVDAKGKIKKLDNPSTPMIFYSRPKGDYLGADAEKVLLDFYVYHATLGSDARVKATINGTDFDVDVWQPYFIEHAPMGDLKVQLQLTDKDGKALEGANTSVSRTAHLAAGEPMK
jgi:hypothetical protein